MNNMDFLAFSDEVATAKAEGKPIVALESTIIAFGMPYPQNIETAREVENVILENGAVPATIAVMDGKIRVGLCDDELSLLAQSEKVIKLSRRDMAGALVQNEIGATTVATTMMAASMADIRVFATGGIGGVHRGWGEVLDISADIGELARTKVAVVSAGAKAILDLPATLEVLETSGVPVIGYKTSELPAFYSVSSGLSVPLRSDDVVEISEIMKAHWGLGCNSGGLLIANPVPLGAEISEDEISPIIEAALDEAKFNNILGKDLTPFLLEKLAELTKGDSLKTNIALIKNNARLGAEIACSYNKS